MHKFFGLMLATLWLTLAWKVWQVFSQTVNLADIADIIWNASLYCIIGFILLFFTWCWIVSRPVKTHTQIAQQVQTPQTGQPLALQSTQNPQLPRLEKHPWYKKIYSSEGPHISPNQEAVYRLCQHAFLAGSECGTKVRVTFVADEKFLATIETFNGDMNFDKCFEMFTRRLRNRQSLRPYSPEYNEILEQFKAGWVQGRYQASLPIYEYHSGVKRWSVLYFGQNIDSNTWVS